MKKLCKSFLISFSMYSRIPMPHTEWEEESMRYALCFFPIIGAVLGSLFVGVYVLAEWCGIGVFFRSSLLTALPVIVTGGIHMDGYMDTKDAMCSYRSKEERLAILKDPHIGAFAVISALTYFIVYFGAVTEIDSVKKAILVAVGFMLSRIMSAFCFVTCKSAKKEGLQYTFAEAMQRKAVVVSTLVYLCAVYCFLIALSPVSAVVYFGAMILLYGYYKMFSQRHFGGITGDLAGYYVQLQELVYLLCVVAGGCLLK